MNPESARVASNVVCLDVIYEEPNKAVSILRKSLEKLGVGKITVVKHEEFNEMIPEHVEMRVDDEAVIFIFKPIACHNYNEISLHNLTLNIATIDTMMTFYLAFYYTQKPSPCRDRIFCMVQFMFDISQKWLMDKGILKRFSTMCYGYQPSLTDIRATKTAKKRDTKIVRGSHEFEMWFLNYKPSDSEYKLKLKADKVATKAHIDARKLKGYIRKSAKIPNNPRKHGGRRMTNRNTTKK